MELVLIIIEIILTFLLGLFIKNYLPSYMNEKGKNLATKEDIQEITRKTEEVQNEFKESLELFASDVKFKYDLYYKQYSELYCKLYAIIIQSEYVRHFIFLKEGVKYSFDEMPFIEISPAHKVTQHIKIEAGRPLAAEQSTEEIKTPISQFNKNQLCEYIINNGEYATQRLLKIAVGYRFAYSLYSGNPEVKNSSCEDIANSEELRLIREMVFCIISEYNYFRRELKMDYNEVELEKGMPQIEID